MGLPPEDDVAWVARERVRRETEFEGSGSTGGAARLTPKGSRAVATGGASQRSGTRNPWEWVFCCARPGGAMDCPPPPRWGGRVASFLFHGFRSPLANCTRVATPVGPFGAEHGSKHYGHVGRVAHVFRRGGSEFKSSHVGRVLDPTDVK